jgi:hypothetical protein
MTEESIREIAQAGIEFIEARQKAADLKDARASILRDAECSGSGEQDCYRMERWPFEAFCPRCKSAYAAHTSYKKAVTQRSVTLSKLRRLVTKPVMKAIAQEPFTCERKGHKRNLNLFAFQRTK